MEARSTSWQSGIARQVIVLIGKGVEDGLTVGVGVRVGRAVVGLDVGVDVGGGAVALKVTDGTGESVGVAVSGIGSAVAREQAVIDNATVT
jgi:hypothetical protein